MTKFKHSLSTVRGVRATAMKTLEHGPALPAPHELNVAAAHIVMQPPARRARAESSFLHQVKDTPMSLTSPHKASASCSLQRREASPAMKMAGLETQPAFGRGQKLRRGTQRSDGAFVAASTSRKVVAKQNNHSACAIMILHQDLQMSDKTGQFKVAVGDRLCGSSKDTKSAWMVLANLAIHAGDGGNADDWKPTAAHFHTGGVMRSTCHWMVRNQFGNTGWP